MDYLEYAYLQSGQVDKAKAVLDEMNALPPASGLTLTGQYGGAAIPARFALELGDWKAASKLEPLKEGVPWAQAISWMAIGVGSARTNNNSRAAEAMNTLGSLREQASKMNNTYWANQIDVQRQEVAAWIAQSTGKTEEALKQMRSAAELEESMDKHAVTPGAVIPAREMLAQMLTLQKKPQEAFAEYQAVLKAAPNRFDALYGAATAAEASGNPQEAKTLYEKLTQSAPGQQRPEQNAAREKLASLSAADRSH